MVMMATGEMIVPLVGTPASVGLARTLAASRLNNWDYSHILDDALLVVSELVTNAAQWTPNEEIRFQVSKDADGVIVAVWDRDPQFPRPKPRKSLTLEELDVSEEAFDDNGGGGCTSSGPCRFGAVPRAIRQVANGSGVECVRDGRGACRRRGVLSAVGGGILGWTLSGA
ncbi:ATP-binding protein [Spirillospora sp. NBC_00431]